MGSGAVQSLVTLAVAVLVVFRFARRELVERTVRLNTLWIRPAIMIVLTAYLVYTSLSVDPDGDSEMLSVLVGGLVLGLLTGWGVVHYTRFAPAGIPNAVRVQGSRITFAIWIVAIGIRVLAHFVLPHGADERSQLPLNCGTVIMAAAAFAYIGLAFYRAIRTHAGTATA